MTGDIEPSGAEPCSEGTKSLRDIRKEHIECTLERTGHDIETTARILEISLSKLRRIMTELEIQ